MERRVNEVEGRGVQGRPCSYTLRVYATVGVSSL